MKADHRIKASHQAEHRKELHTNVLADRMGRFMQTVRQRPKGRTILIWLVVIVAIVGLIVWYLWQDTSKKNNSDLWLKLYIGQVEKLAEEHPKTKQAEIAEVQKIWGFLWDFQPPYSVPIQVETKKGTELERIALYGGIWGLKTVPDPKQADKYRKAMEKLFEILEFQYLGDGKEPGLCEKHKEDPILGPETLYDLAVTQETMSAFNIDKLKSAKATFKKLHDDFPGSARGKLAKQRLDEWYNNTDNFQKMTEFYRNLSPKKLTE